MAGYTGTRAAGLWHNEIEDAEYVERIRNIDSGEYGHPGIDGPASGSTARPRSAVSEAPSS